VTREEIRSKPKGRDKLWNIKGLELAERK